MSNLITCMGEILIDFLPIEENGRTAGFRMHPGGSPYNVAMGLARFAQPTAFASKVSTDLFGRFLREHVEREGIDTRFLVASDAPTTLAFVSMEGGEPDYAFYNDGAAGTLLTFEEIPPALFEETSILHFGSISLLSGTTPAAVLATVERLKGRALLSFDPNLRPGLLRDESTYRALLDRLFGLADVLKLSATDLRWLSPRSTVEQAAENLLALGPALVAITRGGDGVLAMRGSETWEVPSFDVRVVDTVGAGDAFSAGLLAGLAGRDISSREALLEADREEIEGALRFAAAVSALTVTKAGADPPYLHEVIRFADVSPTGQAG